MAVSHRSSVKSLSTQPNYEHSTADVKARSLVQVCDGPQTSFHIIHWVSATPLEYPNLFIYLGNKVK